MRKQIKKQVKIEKVNKTKKELKSEQIIKANKSKYENCELPVNLFLKMDEDTQYTYLENALSKKYKKEIKFGCMHCARRNLFDDGNITDEELKESIAKKID